MKRNVLFNILALLAVFGCQVREEGEFASEGKVFMATTEAYIADGVDTKTSMDSEGNVLWKSGDQVSIFAGMNINEQYQVNEASDGRTSAALNKVTNPGFVSGTEISNNVAIYPYSSTTSIVQQGNAYLIKNIELPAAQLYASNSFGNEAFPMTAVTNSNSDINLKFKNVLGGLKLQLQGTATIASISITGNNNERLCGDAEITVSHITAPSISLNDESATTVTLDCGDGVQLSETAATAFIIALPPMTMTGGFTVTVTNTEGATMEIKTTKTQTITRSNILAMPTIAATAFILTTGTENGYEWVDLGLPSGLKWATCNVGANVPGTSGYYFAWGGTTQGGYEWTTCPFRTSGDDWNNVQFSEYNTSSSFGPVDNKTILDPEDDAASVNWGGTWRMPTDAEWTELRTECSWTWENEDYGYYGYLVTGPNGNSIFLPAVGLRYETYLLFTHDEGDYWSSSIKTDNPRSAWAVLFNSDDALRISSERYYGYSVRPVTDEGVRVSVTGISLNKSSIELDVEETETISATVTPSNATQKNVIWSSSDTSVATVSWEGVVTAVAGGTATITATTYDGGITATCSVTITDSNGHALVDLGLPSGLKWATCNIGATAPEEYGDYFAWGGTEPQSSYDWTAYPFRTSGYSYNTFIFSKYNTSDSNGTVDNKITLELNDDAARANWGGSWRMPTDAEWTELMEECTWTWTTQNRINGWLFTGSNGNSIFLPAAGMRDNSILYNLGSKGWYWSSSLDTNGSYQSWFVSLDANYVGISNYGRAEGFSVRPVTDEGVRVSVADISLEKPSLTLAVEETATITAIVSPSNATQKNVIWSSSNTSVAQVSYQGVVTAVAPGTATITATTYDGGFTAICQVTIYEGKVTGHYYVDLGLTSGMKWASCNVGANSPEDYGDYFAWGDPEPYYTEGHSQDDPCSNWNANKTGYNWASYKWCNGSSSTLTKYNTRISYGTFDNNSVLAPEDDAAHVRWVGTWRMPTDSEWTELRTECTWTWTMLNGVNGRLVTGPNGNSIFLPATGGRYDTGLGDTGSYGYYWSSSLYTDVPDHAYYVSFNSDRVGRGFELRYGGLSVRPVTE